MNNNFVAYDDEGIIATGTKRECLDSIVNLCEELDHIYTENELIEIENYFSRKHADSNSIHYSGFSVTHKDECWCMSDEYKGLLE